MGRVKDELMDELERIANATEQTEQAVYDAWRKKPPEVPFVDFANDQYKRKK